MGGKKCLSTDKLQQKKILTLHSFVFAVCQESQLVAGVAFKKTFSYAGFEMQPKRYVNPKIALLNIELELKAEKDNAEVRVNSVEVSTALHCHRFSNVLVKYIPFDC